MGNVGIILALFLSATITPILPQIMSPPSQQSNGIIVTNSTTNNATMENNSTSTSNEQYSDFIYKFRYYLQSDEVPEFLIDIILKNFTQYNISASDVIKLSGIETLSLNQTIQLIRTYRIAPENVFNINTLELLLNLTGMSFNNYYDSVKNRLNLTGPIIMEAMDNLAVDKTKFSGALTFELYNMFDVLRNGSYTEENINKALRTINRTLDDLYNSTRDIVFNRLKTLDAVSFQKILINQFKFDKIKLLLLWNVLNITQSDVDGVEKFKQILDGTIDNLNKFVKLGIVIGERTLVTHELIFDEWWSVQNIAKGHVQPLRNSSANYEVFYRGVTRGSNIIELYSNQVNKNFINITTNYSSFSNCFYISISNESVVKEQVQVVGFEPNSKVILVKNGLLEFNLGNPLICDSKLYGLARAANQTGIIIDGLFEERSEITTQQTISGNGSGIGNTTASSGASSMICVSMSILVAFHILLLI